MALLVTETAAYAPLCDGLSRPTTSTSTFCNTATMERHTDATTRSATTVRRTDRWPPSSASGRTAASQLAHSVRQAGRPPAGPGPHRRPAGLGRRDDLADEDADGRAGGPEAGGDERQDGDDADAHLDQEVDRQRLVGPVGLQEAPVEREQHEEGRRGEDRRDADAALLVQQHGHAVPAA